MRGLVLSVERWEANIIHARQFLHDSENETNFAHTRVFLGLQAGELALKALYYKQYPQGDKVEHSHLTTNLVKIVCNELGIERPQEIIDAVRRIYKHYEAARYPEETTEYFCCATYQVGCWTYPDILEEIQADVNTIFSWAEKQLFH